MNHLPSFTQVSEVIGKVSEAFPTRTLADAEFIVKTLVTRLADSVPTDPSTHCGIAGVLGDRAFRALFYPESVLFQVTANASVLWELGLDLPYGKNFLSFWSESDLAKAS